MAPKYEHKADAGSTIPGKLYFPYDLPGIVCGSHPPMIRLHGLLQYCYYCLCYAIIIARTSDIVTDTNAHVA